MSGGPSSATGCGRACSAAAPCVSDRAACDCRRRSFSGRRRSSSKNLPELQTIPVGVENVEQSHLTMELEHHADVHARVA